MCFYNDDYDWYASVQQVTTPIAEKETRCDECGRNIAIGETMRQIYQQEHEVCECCSESGENDECNCAEPNIGETFLYHCCSECAKFRDAVKQTERDEGCPAHALQPSLCGMIDEIQEFDEEQARKYFETAGRLFPELKDAGYLAKLWNRMGFDEESELLV